MILRILKLSFYLILILIFFALLPKSILDKLKHFLNWETLLKTIKIGWSNLLDFIQNATGIDFRQISVKLKEKFGIDLILFWSGVKKFLANIFQNLANIFK